MNSSQFLRSLKQRGCKIDSNLGKGSHIGVRNGEYVAFVPRHGSRKQLPRGTMRAIEKQLRLRK